MNGENNIAYVRHGNSLSQPIATTKGLRQDCSLSPLLFNIYIERALEEWKRSCQGMGVAAKDRYLFTLNFADDQVVIAQDHFDLEFMVRRLRTIYESWGLTLNYKKTEHLAINSNEKNNLALEEGIQIKQVSHSKYLGTVIYKTDGIGKDEINKNLWKELICLLSLHYLKMSFALKPAFAPT
jgi:hypothetical protein